MKRKRNDSQTEPGVAEPAPRGSKKRSSTKPDSKPRSGTLKPGDAFVAICDWTGIVKWLSNHTIKTQVGDLGWINMIPGDAERFKQAFARTATLHERHIVEIASLDGLRYRIWMWSIGNPDLAVCTFNLMIPTEVNLLTDREREFLTFLAQGLAVKEIALKLDVSINTVHAHMRNVKAKLSLGSPNEVIAFAARFFHQKADSVPVESSSEPPV
jgi:DNA-binding CsgD family transcriptional regulator